VNVFLCSAKELESQLIKKKQFRKHVAGFETNVAKLEENVLQKISGENRLSRS
jgi:hypothetical protein